MRCTNYIALEQYGKKGKFRMVRTRPDWIGRSKETRTLLPDSVTGQIWNPCPGFLACKIKAVDEPDWGDHYAKLEVKFICSHCGEHNFTAVNIPSNNDFEDWVNVMMNTVYEVKFEDELTVRRGFDEVEHALAEKFVKEGTKEPYYEAKKKVWDAALKWGKQHGVRLGAPARMNMEIAKEMGLL